MSVCPFKSKIANLHSKIINCFVSCFILLLRRFMQPIQNIFPLLSQPKKVVITMHQKPDGDTMGSALGLYHFLNKLVQAQCRTHGISIRFLMHGNHYLFRLTE